MALPAHLESLCQQIDAGDAAAAEALVLRLEEASPQAGMAAETVLGRHMGRIREARAHSEEVQRRGLELIGLASAAREDGLEVTIDIKVAMSAELKRSYATVHAFTRAVAQRWLV